MFSICEIFIRVLRCFRFIVMQQHILNHSFWSEMRYIVNCGFRSSIHIFCSYLCLLYIFLFSFIVSMLFSSLVLPPVLNDDPSITKVSTLLTLLVFRKLLRFFS